MLPGCFVGHFWNEAYVGKQTWVPVDTMANEVGSSLALVKLGHSRSIDGAMKLRRNWTGRMSIAVTKTQALPAILSEWATGVRGRIYANTEFACRVTSPVKNWQIQPKPSPMGASVRFVIPAHNQVFIHLVMLPNTAKANVLTLSDARLARYKGDYSDFELLKYEPFHIRGDTGQMTRFRRTSKRNDQIKAITTEVLWTHGAAGYIMVLIAEESAHEKYLPDFLKLVASFEYLGGGTPTSRPNSSTVE